MRPFYVCPFLLASFGLMNAFASDLGRIHGELTCHNCTSYSNVTIDVFDCNQRSVGSYTVGSTGDFDMAGIPNGNYIVTVRGANGSEITSQSVVVRGESASVSIRLPDSGGSNPASREASVSMYQLSHKISKAAKKEFDKAVRAGEDNESAIAHLRKATEVDPDYVEALNNLGTRYIQTNQLDKAMEVLTRAQKLDSASPLVQTNLAVALLAMKKAPDAERAARRAVQLASNDPRARYVLALSLYSKEEYGEETMKLLQASKDHFPNANIALAACYARNGKAKEARNLLNGYLAAGHRDREPQVRQMLASLPK